ncbi:MAG: lysophospholipid acyltransferase family protein, partial [Thermoanaerobaculia bacterium]
MLRLIVAVFSPWVERVGWERLRRLPGPVILAFNHGNSVESVVVPALLMAYREGRPIRFLVDWMYLRIPVLGWLLRQIDPIPVYTKPARWRLFERYRQRRRGASPVAAAVEALAAGHTIGLFPEGTRNASIDSLKPGRKGLGYVVLASEAPVVPVGIDHPARWRLGRMPKIGRMRVTVGEPLGFAYERAALRAAEGARAPRLDLDLLRRRLAGWVVERVIEEVYRDEKGWIENCEGEIAEDASAIEDRSWFLCRVGAEPVGLIRLAYDPPLELP